jgi:hypothetical protein
VDYERTKYSWVNPGATSQVLAWLWYPVDRSSNAAPADYLPYPWRMALAQASGRLMSQFLTTDLGKVHTHSSLNPGVSSRQPSYPVVIMRAGGGALTIDFTTLAENLASYGYVVAGFDAPYRTVVVVLPDGRVILRSRTGTTDHLCPRGPETPGLSWIGWSASTLPIRQADLPAISTWDA